MLLEPGGPLRSQWDVVRRANPLDTTILNGICNKLAQISVLWIILMGRNDQERPPDSTSFHFDGIFIASLILGQGVRIM